MGCDDWKLETDEDYCETYCPYNTCYEYDDMTCYAKRPYVYTGGKRECVKTYDSNYCPTTYQYYVNTLKPPSCTASCSTAYI